MLIGVVRTPHAALREKAPGPAKKIDSNGEKIYYPVRFFDMKKTLLIVAIVLIITPAADACVGKLLTIGVTDCPEGQVLGEIVSMLIKERTGTTVQVRLFASAQELYEAVKVKQVDISIENTTRALHVLNRPPETDPNKAYEVVKATYEKERGLIWLKPFRFRSASGGSGPSYTATVLRLDIINNFPALPRVVGKLGPVLDDGAYTRLVTSVEAGGAPKAVARDFLRSKKLI